MQTNYRKLFALLASASVRIVCLAAMGLPLLGCNSSANLISVVSHNASPVSRSDQFLASAANEEVWVSVGSSGVVLSGDSSGKGWKREVLPGTVSLIGVTVCPDGTFVALDFYRRVWISDKTASNWTGRDLKTLAIPIALTCDSRGNYWIVGSSTTILHSADRGETWLETNQGEDAQFTAIQFVDAEFGVVAGEFGAFLTTQDGGATWQKQPPISPDFYPYAVLFLSRDVGWIAGPAGALMETKNRGKTWVNQQNASQVSMYAFAKHANQLFALGDNGRMVRFDGKNWVNFEHGQPVHSFLHSAVSLDREHMLISGGAGALYSIAVGDQAGRALNAK